MCCGIGIGGLFKDEINFVADKEEGVEVVHCEHDEEEDDDDDCIGLDNDISKEEKKDFNDGSFENLVWYDFSICCKFGWNGGLIDFNFSW